MPSSTKAVSKLKEVLALAKVTAAPPPGMVPAKILGGLDHGSHDVRPEMDIMRRT